MSDVLLSPKDKKDTLPYSRPATPDHGHRVGVYGLGAIGYHVAKNLANSLSSLPLVVYNRTVAKSEKLAKELGPNKVSIVQSPAELVDSCDIIFTILANDEVVKSAYKQFYQALQATPSGTVKIFVESSTIYPTVAGELDNLISSVSHARFITCPVFGAPAVAAKGLLIAAMSGDYRSKKEVAYLLVPAVAQKVIDLGGNVEKGSAPTFKLFGNSLILGTMEAMAESLTLAEKAGVDSSVALTLLNDLFPAPIMTGYADKMAHDRFDGTQGFSIDGGIKDASHIRRLTSELNSPMPLIDIAHQHMLTARAGHISNTLQGTAKYETLDWSALVSGVRVTAGLAATGSGSHTGVVLDE
ncbi:NAD-binding protein [Thelephora ganbajun]|uniref:NAD-binding protein n=1 Tax=Thelephora ganbajun TaxID=370292 RepID=A0ACB6ZXU3_THEGA|nr:NAD-binding protein [Thelephora ganbajun]